MKKNTYFILAMLLAIPFLARTKQTSKVVYLHEHIAQKTTKAWEPFLGHFIGKGNVILTFYASYCNPCKNLAPSIDNLSQSMSDFTFVKVQWELFQNLVTKYTIESIPTLIFLRDGQEIGRYDGGPLTQDQLAEVILNAYSSKKEEAKPALSSAEPKKGSPAPAVQFSDSTGKTVSISDFKGCKIALAFLPSTSSISFRCKTQACSLNADLEDLVDYGITMIGVSADSADSLEKFIEKNELTFPLWHADKNAIKAYNVDALVGIQRHTFLIDENGIIVKVIKDVDVNNHAQQIIDGFAAV